MSGSEDFSVVLRELEGSVGLVSKEREGNRVRLSTRSYRERGVVVRGYLLVPFIQRTIFYCVLRLGIESKHGSLATFNKMKRYDVPQSLER